MNKWEIFCILCFLNSAILLVLWYAPITYDTPDDSMMLLFASGAYTGTPSEYLIYNGTVLGLLLKNLYIILPEIEWYSVFHYFMLLAAMNTILWQIFVTKFSTLQKILVTSFVLLILSKDFLSPQFTTLASILGFTSMVLLLSKQTWQKYLGSMLFFLMGIQCRCHAVLLVFALGLPIFLIPFNVKDKIFRKRILFGLLLIFIAGGNILYENATYNSTEWKDYNSYNKIRGNINDNPYFVIKNFENEYTEVQNIEMIQLTRFWQDGHILKQKELLDIYQTIKNHSSLVQHIFVVKAYIMSYMKWGGLAIVVIFLLFIIKFKNKGWTKGLMYMTLSLLLLVAVTFYLSSVSFPKDRVNSVVIITSFFSICYILYHFKMFDTRIYVFCASIMSFCIFHCIKQDFYRHKAEIEAEKVIEDILAKTPYNKVFFPMGIPMMRDAFKYSNSYLGKKLVRSGWNTNSPHNNGLYDGYQSLIYNKIPVIVDDNSEKWLEDVRKILLLAYKKTVKVETIALQGNYRIVVLSE